MLFAIALCWLIFPAPDRDVPPFPSVIIQVFEKTDKDTIEDVARDALLISKLTNRHISMSYKKFDMVVTPDDTISEIVERWKIHQPVKK